MKGASAGDGCGFKLNRHQFVSAFVILRNPPSAQDTCATVAGSAMTMAANRCLLSDRFAFSQIRNAGLYMRRKM